MNILSLRVSSVRSGENLKKNSEVRMEKLMLSDEFMADFDPAVNKYLISLNTAPSVEDQVHQVRNVLANTDISADEKLHLFVAIYLVAPLKHAVRGAIVKIFQSAYKGDSTLADVLCKELETYLTKNADLAEWMSYFPVISTLTGLFENINITHESCSIVCDKMYYFLLKVWRRVAREYFSSQASPSLTNEILLLNHNILRVILSLCQEFGVTLKTRAVDFDELQELLEAFLADENVPMDTKTNCGHLKIILSKLNHTYDELIRRKFSEERGSFCENVGIVVDINRGDAISRPNTWSLMRIIATETKEYALESSKQQQMVLACSRLIFRMSKMLPQFPVMELNDAVVLSVVELLMDFVFSHLENFMDSVRHMSRDSLKLTLSFCLTVKLEAEVTKLFQRIHEGCSRHVRFLTLSCIASVYGSRMIIGEFPDIIEELIGNFRENCFDASAANAFEVLMQENKKEETVEVWIERWMNPLIFFLNELPTTDQNTKIVVETLIGKAVKNNQEVIRALIQNLDIPISIRLTVLSMAKKCGKLNCDTNSSNLWKGSIPIDHLRMAMVNFDDRVRIQSLKLVTETPKITEPYEEIDLKLIKFFFHFNANCQSPATRDQIMALFRNCFIKLAALLGSCAKKKDTNGLEQYQNFLLAIRDQCFANLRLNGNFSRRTMSLSFIEQVSGVLQTCSDKEQSLNYGEVQEEVDELVKCLGDSYECNKLLAMNILRNFYSEKSILMKHSDLQIIRPLIVGVNPLDSQTGAYHLQLIVGIAKRQPELFRRKLFVTLQWLIEIAEEGIAMGRSSLVVAAKRNPIYGALLCIRQLLSDLDINSVKHDRMWREFLSKLIRTCFECSDVVKSIVNNSSPEGHLPNDFGSAGEKGVHDDNVTPQMILLMGWRTIKEVSLLLGDISKYPIVSSSDPQQGLVTIAEFFQIGDTFRELLAEIKHRGAFEQAYVGFSKLCCRLWVAQEEELHSRPMTWLKESLDIVQGKVQMNSKICATRRSAGVPFMVQALITSEIQVCSSRALRYSMDILFDMCESKDSSAEAKTHAMNILRALFRCTDLNEAVVEFVDRGMMASISSFAGETWPEKNSATLLFSALIIRIFGVQLTKDTEVLNVRNKMTGRIFFLRYPKLFDFFLREVGVAEEILSRNGRAVKLFPTLLVLSRLYPSALEGTESSLSLDVFVHRIEKCSQCPELKTRVLIAKSIASLLNSNLAWDYLSTVIASFESATDLNEKHSKLLIVQQVLSSPQQKLESASEDDVNEFLRKFIKLSINFKHWILTKAFQEILIVILQKFRSHVLQVHFDELMDKVEQLEQILLAHRENEGEMGYTQTLSPFVVLQLQLCATNDEGKDNVASVLLRQLETDIYREAALGVALLIMYEAQQELPDDLELTRWERSFVASLSNERKKSLKQQLDTNVRVPEISQDIVVSCKSSYDLRNKALALLAYFPASKSTTAAGDNRDESIDHIQNELLDDNASYQARAATYKWYSRNCERLEHALPLGVVQKYSSIENSFDVRMTSAEILKRIPVVGKILDGDNKSNIVRYMSVVLLLLRDDDAEVRESISSVVHRLLTGPEGCFTTIELYSQKRFVEWMASQLRMKFGADETILLLTDLVEDIQKGHQEGLAIRTISCTAEEDATNNDENRVFDRNEANQFAEIEAVIKVVKDEISWWMCHEDAPSSEER